MVKKRWNRDFSDVSYFWDKLTLCTLLRLSTTTYKDRIDLYDGLDDDPVADGFYFLKDHIKEIPEDSLIYDFKDIFDEKSDYEDWSRKSINKEYKEKILSKSKEMIRKYSTSLQTWRAILKHLPWELLVFIGLVLVPCNIWGNQSRDLLVYFNFLMGCLFIISLGGHIFVERTLKKGKSLSASLNYELKTYSSFQWAEEEIEKLLDLYSSTDKSLLNKTKEKKQKIDYESMSREEKEEAFFLRYPKIKETYPLFFEVYRFLGILDEEDRLISPEKDQKELLIVINAIREGSRHKLKLLQELFKTSYSEQRLKEHANEKKIVKAEKLVNQLKKTQDRIQANAVKSK